MNGKKCGVTNRSNQQGKDSILIPKAVSIAKNYQKNIYKYIRTYIYIYLSIKIESAHRHVSKAK